MKIIMATMSLDIGGAETHIVELSKALKKQGHEILIASAGGAYVAEMTASGITHVDIPMNRRNFSSMLSARKQLKQLILAEKPDIVHAHARIPAFLCGTLHKKLKFPFVTTAHWVFSTGGILGYLTNWGQRVIAVSEDIKTYLQEAYHYPSQHISVTINGIDTEKFSPTRTGDSIRTEFAIPDTAFVLCSVSRLDRDRALVAEQLLELATKLSQEIPELVLLIVGGGNVFSELEEKAKTINKSLGRDCILMTGPRTDINEVIAVCDLFVGVSRSALEAMSAEKLVIVAGNEGYQGIFRPESLEEAISGNFCCRGLPLSTTELLLQDILTAVALPQEEQEVLGRYGREVISQHYSVGRMANDCLAMYRQLPCYKVLMSGYYGFDNAGDDAILQAIAQQIQGEEPEKSVEITVLSNNPKETTTRYGLPSIPRFHVWKVMKALKDSDALLSGGGSLLQDRTSTRSILYYLWVISLGHRFGKPVMMYANGIGPVTKKANRRRVAKAVEEATVVTLRDKDSGEELRAMGVLREDLIITADPVQGMSPAAPEVGRDLLQRAGVTGDFVSISVREWGDMEKFSLELGKFCDMIVERTGYQILFILMQPSRDSAVSMVIQSAMTQPSLILEEHTSPDQLMAVLGQAKFCVAMRLHTLIFSARMGVPLLGLVYDPKVESFLRETDMLSCGDVAEFTAESGKAQLEQLLQQYEAYKETIVKQQVKLEEKAKENQKLLLSMLGDHNT